MPPATHTAIIGSGPGSLSAIPAGDRKIPDPIVDPITTAVALHTPSLRWSSFRCGGSAFAGLDIRKPYSPRSALARGRTSLHPRNPRTFTVQMPTQLADFLFWTATAIIAVTQVLILRSTLRGMRVGPPGSGSVREWTFAILPAICLAALLVWTWHTMHAGVFKFDAKAPGVGVTA
jgi:hypothetical protein